MTLATVILSLRLNTRVPAFVMAALFRLPLVPPLPTSKVPPEMVVVPVLSFTPELAMVSLPAPCFTIAEVPLSLPAPVQVKSLVSLLTVKVAGVTVPVRLAVVPIAVSSNITRSPRVEFVGQGQAIGPVGGGLDVPQGLASGYVALPGQVFRAGADRRGENADRAGRGHWINGERVARIGHDIDGRGGDIKGARVGCDRIGIDGIQRRQRVNAQGDGAAEGEITIDDDQVVDACRRRWWCAPNSKMAVAPSSFRSPLKVSVPALVPGMMVLPLPAHDISHDGPAARQGLADGAVQLKRPRRQSAAATAETLKVVPLPSGNGRAVADRGSRAQTPRSRRR